MERRRDREREGDQSSDQKGIEREERRQESSFLWTNTPLTLSLHDDDMGTIGYS